MTSSSTNY